MSFINILSYISREFLGPAIEETSQFFLVELPSLQKFQLADEERVGTP